MPEPLTPEGAKELEKKFDQLLERDCDECTAKGAGTLARFRGMLKRPSGGWKACADVIALSDNPPPSGYVKLWDLGLLHLTAEARVLEWPWCQLFLYHDRPDVLQKAQHRLRTYERSDLAHCRCLDG